MENYSQFNAVLVRLFNDILDYEIKALVNSEFFDITNNDIHVIEAIGMDDAMNMSKIAKKLSVTMGSLTIAINSLLRKGYVLRQRSKLDKRVIFIELSEKGKRAYLHHQSFHKQMIEEMTKGLEKDEIVALSKALSKIDEWMQQTKQQ